MVSQELEPLLFCFVQCGGVAESGGEGGGGEGGGGGKRGGDGGGDGAMVFLTVTDPAFTHAPPDMFDTWEDNEPFMYTLESVEVVSFGCSVYTWAVTFIEGDCKRHLPFESVATAFTWDNDICNRFAK